MAAAYTKEFLVEAFATRYAPLGDDAVKRTREMANAFYDKVGKDKFRVYTSLDAEAIRKFKTKK